MHQAFGHSRDGIFVSAARWGHSACTQRRRWRHGHRQGIAKALVVATVAVVAVMARLPSTWVQPTISVSGHPTSHILQLSSYRQAGACPRYGGHLAKEQPPLTPFLLLKKTWRCKELAECGRNAKVSLAGKKKKKLVDPDILDKRARAAEIREEALKKAAETKRLKELGQSAEAAPAKPMVSTKQVSPSQAVTTAKPAKPVASSEESVGSARQRVDSQRPSIATAPTKKPLSVAELRADNGRKNPRSVAELRADNGRKNPRSVAELKAIQSLDRHPQKGAMTERPKATGSVQVATRGDAATMRPTKEEVMKMKVVDLKDVLRSNKLKVGGRKADLLERVLSFLEAA